MASCAFGGLTAGCVVIAAAVGAAGAGAAGGSGAPDVTTLIPRARSLVRSSNPQLRSAVLYEADGLPARSGASVRTAAGIVQWQFVYDVPNSSRYAHAMISYGPAPHRFGRVVASRSPWLEDQVISRAPRLTLAEAVGRLRKAGYRQAFSSVVLRWPLYPKATVAYIFTLPTSYVAVDVYNGKVQRVQ